MAEETTTGTAGDGTATDAGGTQKVTFTPEQQAKLDTLIDGAYTKAYEKAEKKSQTQIDELNTKIEKLTPKETDDKKGKVSDEDWQAKLEAVQNESNEKLEKQQKANLAVQNKIIRADIMAAAASADCTEPADLAEIMISSGQVAFDEDGEIVITPTSGILKLGDDGSPISLEQYVKRFIATKPMWQKAAVGQGGAGSGDGGSQPGKKKLLEMDPKDIAELSDEAYEKMRSEQFKKNKGWLE